MTYIETYPGEDKTHLDEEQLYKDTYRVITASKILHALLSISICFDESDEGARDWWCNTAEKFYNQAQKMKEDLAAL